MQNSNLKDISIFENAYHGLSFPSTTSNTNFTNLVSENNTNYNLYLVGTGNTIILSQFQNASKVYVVAGNYFNNSIVGNYWSNLTCLANTSKVYNGLKYYVCTNPSNYFISGSIYDLAPLADPNGYQFAITPTFISPTPNNNVFISSLSYNNITITVSLDFPILSCDLKFNNSIYSMSLINSTLCTYTVPLSIQSIYKYNVSAALSIWT